MSHKIDFTTLSSASTVLSSTSRNFSYTATTFGFIYIVSAVANNANVSFTINGGSYGKVQGGAAAFTWITTTIPVAKNDIVTATSSDSGDNAQIMGCYLFTFS